MKDENRFGNEYYSNGLEFTKDVLRASSSISDIIENANIVEETKEEMKKRISEGR